MCDLYVGSKCIFGFDGYCNIDFRLFDKGIFWRGSIFYCFKLSLKRSFMGNWVDRLGIYLRRYGYE